MNRSTTFAGGKTIVIGGAAISLFMSVGVVAAATGNAPWSEAGPAVHEPVVEPATTEPIEPGAPVIADAATTATDASTDGAGDAPAGQPTATGDEPAVPEPGGPDTTVVSDEPVTAPTSTAVPEGPVSPGDEPTTTAAPTADTTPAPTTTEFHDTVVPLGIALQCTVVGSTVTCNWSVGDIPGFAKFLLLRGNGGSQGRVPFQTTDPDANHAIDSGVPAGSYSYLVVALDGNGKTLVHSNPVIIQIDAAS